MKEAAGRTRTAGGCCPRRAPILALLYHCQHARGLLVEVLARRVHQVRDVEWLPTEIIVRNASYGCTKKVAVRFGDIADKLRKRKLQYGNAKAGNSNLVWP